jgi:hypothetical protein
MRQFAMVVTAVMMFGGMVASSQAEALFGAPVRQGDKCFNFSPGGDWKDNRFGHWGACPAKASASSPALPVTTPAANNRRNRASR